MVKNEIVDIVWKSPDDYDGMDPATYIFVGDFEIKGLQVLSR